MWVIIHIPVCEKTMKTIQMTIDDDLLVRVDQATHFMGIARSAFIRRALELALRKQAIDEMERQQIAGYQCQPVSADEFDGWEAEQAWGSG